MNRFDREARALDVLVLGVLVVVVFGAFVALGLARVVLDDPRASTTEAP